MTQSLTTLSKDEAKGFISEVKKEYVKKYAQDVVSMLEDQKKLKKAYDKVTKWIEEVEAGNWEAIEKYKKARVRLSQTEDGNFE